MLSFGSFFNKFSLCSQCAKMVQKYFLDKESLQRKEEKSQELKLRRLANFMAKEVKNFWANVNKVRFCSFSLLFIKVLHFIVYFCDCGLAYCSWCSWDLRQLSIVWNSVQFIVMNYNKWSFSACGVQTDDPFGRKTKKGFGPTSKFHSRPDGKVLDMAGREHE